MLVLPLEERVEDCTVPLAPVCELLEAIGKSDFVARLLQSARQLVGADFVSAFVYPARDRAIFIGTDGPPGPQSAHYAAENYLKRHYRDDPNMDVLFDAAAKDRTLVTYVRRDDIPTASYRSSCYDRVQIVDRLSLLTATHQGQACSVSFYRGARSGEFSASERDLLQRFLPVVRSATRRHVDLWRGGNLDIEAARFAVKSRFPKLSPRESDVISGVVVGMTAEEIGQWLGIAPTSVITHRKKAYERVEVGNQRELLRLFYKN